MRRGFTLAELAIVIIIIAILAALAIPQFTRMQERAKASAAKAKLDMIRKAETIWHSLHDNYTTDVNKSLAVEVPEVRKVNDSDWNFTILTANDTHFVAEAKRNRGNWAGTNITIDENGTINGTHPFK